jgi:pyridoxal phosphate enzyme (YggS family)
VTRTDGPLEPAAAAERLRGLRARIAAAAERAGRSPADVTVVAVGKGFDAAAIAAVRAAGQVDFGENRAQELTAKTAALGPGVRWHFIGRLQRNKVRDVVGVVALIHSVDRLELAEPIAERASRDGRVQRILVQVNQGADPAKAGCAPEDAPELVSRIRTVPGIACEGLMTVPPLGSDPRPVFRGLRRLRDELRARYPEVQHLSMGMSADYEVAVEEGATIVRLGAAVFGPRPVPTNRTGHARD